MGLSYVVYWFATEGFNLTLNIFNFTLLFLGILLHWTPKRLLTAFEEGVKASYGVVLQFPFYAGIQGMMGGSGLVTIIANWFLSISTAATFPVFTYISAAIVNFFIPSSGGIFMIQGPVMMEAGMALGVPAATIVNSFSAGEVISNLVQPFWAIPLLGLAGLKMKDIVGYCILSFLIASILYIAAFLIF
jgi:short-chain fatty acids transporter